MKTKKAPSRFNADVLHLGFMLMLYLGQGFFQGLCLNMSLFLQIDNPKLSLQSQAALKMPLQVFSFKFLWAPVVDGIYLSLRHRRPLWIVSCQVIMCAMFGCLWYSASSILPQFGDAASTSDDDSWFGELSLLVPFLITLSFLSATQDIAVDAWAVEGVRSEYVSYASMVQDIGLLTGVGLTQLTVLLVDKRIMELSEYFAFVAALFFFILALSLLYLWSNVCTVSLNVTEENYRQAQKEQVAKTGGASSMFGDIWSLLKDVHTRSLLLILVFQGLAFAGGPLVQSDYIARLGVPASYFAELSIASLFAQFVGTAISGRLLAKSSSADIWRRLGTIEYVLYVPLIASTAIATNSSLWLYGVMMPYMVALTVLGSSRSVSAAPIRGIIARRVPSATGTSLTLMNSIGNMGRSMPNAAALYALGFVRGSPMVLSWLTNSGLDVSAMSSMTPSELESCCSAPVLTLFLVAGPFFFVGTLIWLFVCHRHLKRLRSVQ